MGAQERNAIKVDSFESIRLDDMDRVKLMNRMDRKFWFSQNELQQIIDSVSQHYYLLDIGGCKQMPYSTTYFDTLDDKMFVEHHNGKLNRYKIRKRNYLVSGIGFLEVKFKDNKGRTQKKRIQMDSFDEGFTEKEAYFINLTTPYNTSKLHASLENSFTRLTLVNKNFKERCTIDLNINYDYEGNHVDLENLVVVEVKSDGKQDSPLIVALRNHRLKASGFSKYCIGRSVTDKKVKRNAFKNKIRSIEKVMKTNFGIF